MAVLLDEQGNYIGATPPAPAGTNPETGKPMGVADAAKAAYQGVTGDKGDATNGMNPLELGLAGAGNQYAKWAAGLQGQPAPDAGRLMENFPSRVGAVVPQALGSLLGGVSILGQALASGAMAAMEPGSAMERGVAGLKAGVLGGVGQGLATGLVKSGNALAGDLTPAGTTQQAAKAAGLDLSAGDMLNSPTLRAAEKLGPISPTRNQVDQVAAIMTHPQGDPITKGVKDAYEAANQRVAAAAGNLDTIIAQNSLPKVAPVETIAMLREIAQRHPGTINAIDDETLKDRIMSLVNAKAVPNLSFTEMDELRRAIGPVTAKLDRQAESGASNVTTATANRWKQLYGGIIQDLDAWGAKSNLTEDALAAHNQMKDTFKNEVLPLREHPIAGKILEDKYQRPEDLVRDIIAPRNKSVLQDLYGALDQGGKNAFDAIQMAKRGTKEFVNPPQEAPSWIRPTSLVAGGAGIATAPHWLPAVTGSVSGPMAAGIGAGVLGEQALVHGLNSTPGKRMLGGSPRIVQGGLPNAAGYAAIRQPAIFGALEAMRQRLNSQQE